jgi:hypothetical protein
METKVRAKPNDWLERYEEKCIPCYTAERRTMTLFRLGEYSSSVYFKLLRPSRRILFSNSQTHGLRTSKLLEESTDGYEGQEDEKDESKEEVEGEGEEVVADLENLEDKEEEEARTVSSICRAVHPS